MSASNVPSARAKKRKATEDGGSRKKQKAGASFEDDGLMDLEAGVNKAIAVMDSQLLADHLAQRTTRFGTDLSSVELSDLHISANDIKDTASYAKPRQTDNLPDFLETFSTDPKKLWEAPKKKGAPHTIIVAGAGLRAADIARVVRKNQKKGSAVAKLFAKHIKIEESTKFLESTRTSMGVGTPARLIDLLENGSLSVKNLQRLVVDASYIDQKKRGVMDMKDTMMPLVRWLARKEFKERYTEDEKHIDLLFF